MNKVSKWIDNNMDQFFALDPNKTDLANYKERNKIYEHLLSIAE